MIFDDIPQPKSSGDPPRKRVRRRRRSSESLQKSSSTSRREGSFERASRLQQTVHYAEDRSPVVWLSVLGFLILVTVGFAFYLHNDRSSPRQLPGEAPTARLVPFVDPILAPLQTGGAGYDTETLESVAKQFRKERENAGKDDAEIYSAAATIADFLGEALADRERHLQRLEALNAPGSEPNPTQLKHLELAVDMSWRRNSTTHRDSIEQIWNRLQRLEQGRFRVGPPSTDNTGLR